MCFYRAAEADNDASFVGRWKYGQCHDMAVTKCRRAQTGNKTTTPFCKLGVFVHRIWALQSKQVTPWQARGTYSYPVQSLSPWFASNLLSCKYLVVLTLTFWHRCPCEWRGEKAHTRMSHATRLFRMWWLGTCKLTDSFPKGGGFGQKHEYSPK